MGQSLSNNPPSPTRMTSQGTLRQSFKRVYSEELDEAKRGGSRSLPGSPTGGAGRKRLGDLTPTSADSSPEMQLTLESVLKNFEKFAQHQWPTWAKRRGWIAEFPEASGAASDSADENGRVVQLDKDKWAFQRRRKRLSSASTPTKDVAPELVARPDNKEEAADIGKMVDILHIEETRPGQRSRRSSGYASASSSPSLAAKRGLVPDATDAATDDLEKWRTSLYEVTLRWMFESEPLTDEFPHLKRIHSAGEEPEEDQTTQSELIPPAVAMTTQEPRPIRIYLHLIHRQSNHKSTSFIDFCPIQPADGGSPERQLYALFFQNGNTAPQTSFPRQTTCSELIRVIIECHPFLLDYEASKLALYEKSWRPGKTSRARLRRLNDTECPLILANQWLEETDDASGCAKTLVLQESQNGDIPWEDFTMAELSSFLRVLDREEANHELQIRERYQLLNRRLLQSMQQSDPCERRDQNHRVAVLPR